MEDLVFVVIVAVRLLVPLSIPRFPLPGVVAALIIDAADQTVFAALDAEPGNYQQFDKALDIYYLAIAYLSTLRNWTDGIAFRVAQFLWYYRLIGVAAFELSGVRALLLIFPNTFEFFFIFYELVRVCWEPSSLRRKVVVGAAAAIWVFIKLPQEFWIHILQLDATEVLSENPGVLVALVVLGVVAGAYLNRWWATLPPADWRPTFQVDAHATTVVGRAADGPIGKLRLLEHPLIEKTFLVSLVIVIFLQLVDDNDAGVIEIMIGVGAVIVATSFVEQWVASRRDSWHRFTSFACSCVINVGIVIVLGLLPLHVVDDDPGVLFTWFLLLLLAFIVTIYDRYRMLRYESFKALSTVSTS